MGIRCYLIEPIYGNLLPYSDDAWRPHREIVGWIRNDTGERHQHNTQFPVGAMWYAPWIPVNWTWQNETEPHLMVRCPNGPDSWSDWDIDSRASNCTLPDDELHRCWVRHGIPPNITVDKAGRTCQAGAGSILLPHWHGFLRNGELVT